MILRIKHAEWILTLKLINSFRAIGIMTGTEAPTSIEIICILDSRGFDALQFSCPRTILNKVFYCVKHGRRLLAFTPRRLDKIRI